MGKWVLYTQLNYAHSKPTHLTPLKDNPDGKNKDFIENLQPKVLALKAELDMAQSFNVDSVSQNKNLIEEISSSFMI